MNKLNNLFMILLSANSGAVLAKDDKNQEAQVKSEIIDDLDTVFRNHFEETENMFQKMREAHEKMFQTMFDDFNSESVSKSKIKEGLKVSVTQDDKYVFVKLLTEVEDASLIKVDSEEGVLTAIIPAKDGDIKININGIYLKVRARKESRKEEKDKDGKVVSSFVEFGNVSQDQVLPAKVDVNNVEASYNKENNEFTLKIEKKEKKSIVVTTK